MLRDKMLNPVIRRAVSNTEKAQEEAVSYKGVMKKSGLFLLMFVLGAAIAILVHVLTPQTYYGSYANGTFSCSLLELILMIATAVIGFITSLIASFLYRAAAICGTIACICFGYPIGFLASAMPAYQGPVILALVLTVLLVGVLIVLYRTRIIKVNQKFKAFILATVITVLIGSLLMLILSLIPATSGAVAWIRNNPVLSILFGIGGVMLGCFFLLWDFDSIETAVNEGVDKKYENILAFSLAFSVIYLYFKVLQLILRVVELNKN